MSHPRIHPIDLLTNPSIDLCIVDVRTAAEVHAASLPGCLYLPLHELTPARLLTLAAKGGKNPAHIYLLCQSGKRAEIAADQLLGNIDAQLTIIDGGMSAIEQSNIEVSKSHRKTLSLEQQVRIVAGLLVLVGVTLGAWVHPGFYGLSAFVGAGLVFAGVTDICAMGMLLAKAPWNKAPQHKVSSN